MGLGRRINNKVIALAGNPNVGKSTVFNQLTGLNQHTGNWPGKTVGSALGKVSHKGEVYTLADVPGAYSLAAQSAEEEAARDFLCFGGADAVVIVADATCLAKSLNFVLQTLEAKGKAVLCVNLLDEAAKKNISIDLDKLSHMLGIPVAGTCARSKEGLEKLMDEVAATTEENLQFCHHTTVYSPEIERAVEILQSAVSKKTVGIDSRWLSLRLLDYDHSFYQSIKAYIGADILIDADVAAAYALAKKEVGAESVSDKIASCLVKQAEAISAACVSLGKDTKTERERKIDRILMGKITAFPCMIVFLTFIFWFTIIGANYPSQLLYKLLFAAQKPLMDFVSVLGLSPWVSDMMISGVYRVVAWVVSVMLPPMAIFFPLFTILEDVGYLPRIAFNLDGYFKKSCACGKQALTMCMG